MNIKSLFKKSNVSARLSKETDIIPHPFIFLGILCFICALMFDTSASTSMTVWPISLFGIITIFVIIGVLYASKVISKENAIMGILFAGFIIRLCYVLYTSVHPTRERQHDLYSFGGGRGHSGYIEHFYNNGLVLPDVDPTTVTQFYHPPLHHILASFWMHIQTFLGFSYDRAICGIQFLTMFYSGCIMVLSYKIFKVLKLQGIALTVAFSIIAFHPTLILLSGSINNDVLSVLFLVAIIYNTILWWNNPSYKRILCLALVIGLGMLTKLSVALITPAVACVFLIKLLKEKNSLLFIKQYLAFGCLCIPLGLSYALRNLIKYNVPLTYVAKLGEDSDQYLGNYSVWERLFDFSDNPLSSVFLARVHTGASYFEYNPIIALFKTSLFGEYDYGDKYPQLIPFATIFFYVNVALALIGLVALIYFVFKKNNYIDIGIRTFFGVAYFLNIFSFIKFAFDYPHNCSQDFRYAVTTLFIGAYFIGLAVQKFTDDKKALRGKKKRQIKSTKLQTASIVTISSLTAAFSVLSLIVYTVLDS